MFSKTKNYYYPFFWGVIWSRNTKEIWRTKNKMQKIIIKKNFCKNSKSRNKINKFFSVVVNSISYMFWIKWNKLLFCTLLHTLTSIHLVLLSFFLRHGNGDTTIFYLSRAFILYFDNRVRGQWWWHWFQETCFLRNEC